MDINIIVRESSNGLTADGMITLGLGIITLFISLVTIRITKKQFSDDKRLTIKPYLNCEKEELIKESSLNKQVQNIKCYEHIIFMYGNVYGHMVGEDDYQFRLNVHNVGLGHAINCKITQVYTKNNEDDFKVIGLKKFLGPIKVTDNLEIDFNIKHTISNEHLELIGTGYNSFDEYLELNKKVYQESVKDIYMDIKYSDVLFNEYMVTIHFKFCNYIDYKSSLEDSKIVGIGTTLSICYEDSEEKLIKLNKNAFKK